MHNIYKFSALSALILLTACQTTPRSYNGITGYSVEAQSENHATLTYTLAGRQNQPLDQQKLHAACQKVLGHNNTYQIKVLSMYEIANPKQDTDQFGRQIGNTRTQFALTNTQDLHSQQNYATLQALEARPSTLQVIRYTCSL